MEKERNKPKKYSAIGLRIKERMKANGLTQPDLAKAASVSQPAISQMLSNESPSKYLPKLCIPLKSPYEWLAYGRGERIASPVENTPPVENLPIGAFTDMVVQRVSNMTPSERRMLFAGLERFMDGNDGDSIPSNKAKRGALR